jgi:Skp family chaperone for outer membrane proteins
MVCLAITTFHSLRFVESADELSRLKVGVINVQQVIVSTAEGKQALTELQGKFAQRQNDLTILNQEINVVRQRLEAGQTLAEAEQTYRLRSDGERLAARFERKTKEFNEDLQLERSKIVDDIRRKVVNLLVRYLDSLLSPPMRAGMLTRQAEMVSQLEPDLGREWANELFALALQVKGSRRPQMQGTALSILIRLDPDRALERCHL